MDSVTDDENNLVVALVPLYVVETVHFCDS